MKKNTVKVGFEVELELDGDTDGWKAQHYVATVKAALLAATRENFKNVKVGPTVLKCPREKRRNDRTSN